MRAVSIIYSINLCIGRHTCHRYVYLLWLAFICNIFQRLIYLLRSECTSFRLLRDPVNFIIWSVRFRKICDEMILRSISEACIWFLTVKFIRLIIRFAWIKGWFILAHLLFLFLKVFIRWLWTYIVTALWLRQIFSLIISYLIGQIQIINL